MVTEAAREGDPLSIELLADVGRWLGIGVAGLAAAFDPNCIVIGGGVSDAGDLLLEPTREAMVRSLVGRGLPRRAAGPASPRSARRPASSAPPTWRGRLRAGPGGPTASASASVERQQLRQQLREQRGEGWFRRSASASRPCSADPLAGGQSRAPSSQGSMSVLRGIFTTR